MKSVCNLALSKIESMPTKNRRLVMGIFNEAEIEAVHLLLWTPIFQSTYFSVWSNIKPTNN